MAYDDDVEFGNALPLDATREERMHRLAQIAVQALAQVLMNTAEAEKRPGINPNELINGLMFGVSMMLATNPHAGTRQQLRLMGEQYGKMIAEFARVLRETEDSTQERLFQMLGIRLDPLN